ncbi:PilZ domain-containing protein [Selenomonas sp.]|uniref:flagellar brake protein n=1 Tax=Selenomonas sp. TaxID=2053611 RepID=UPI0025F78CEB|nr:PilZ domain-containing protein [Selenomonas sp.]MCI6283607.1 PilZ domain-containing protein [Selenomonas sp.]
MPTQEEAKKAEEVLHAGQFIHLGVPDEEEEGGLRMVQGRIDDLALRYLAVELDVEVRDFLSSPAAGTDIACAVTGDGCVYRFTVGFRGCSRLPVRQWFLERPLTVTRIQMRQFVRVPLELPLAVKLPGDHGSMKNAADTTLVDISGGGLSFVSDEKVLLSAAIAVDIPELPGYGELRTGAKVKRCTPITTPTGRRIYHIGASFDDDFARAEQERLIQTVFELQRSYLQRGLRMPHLDHTQRAKEQLAEKMKNG